MGKAFETFDGQTVGHVGLGEYGDGIGTVKQEVYDGDTIIVRALGNISIRFLAIDTPEEKIPLPGKETFTSLSDSQWDNFLTDPFAARGPLDPSPFSAGLTAYIRGITGAGTAANHKKHADIAKDYLEKIVQDDLDEMINSNIISSRDKFEFYLRFSCELMDRYGRLLAFINREQRDENAPSPRPDDYNTRMCDKALASPYFIWPNIKPWFGASIMNAVPAPGTAKTLAESTKKLKEARDAIKANRLNHVGIYDATDPLRIEAFEIRYLSRPRPPDRWVIDMSKNDNMLIHPQNYYTIPLSEDRLFIPEQYVPLFVEKGWVRQVAP